VHMSIGATCTLRPLALRVPRRGLRYVNEAYVTLMRPLALRMPRRGLRYAGAHGQWGNREGWTYMNADELTSRRDTRSSLASAQ